MNHLDKIKLISIFLSPYKKTISWILVLLTFETLFFTYFGFSFVSLINAISLGDNSLLIHTFFVLFGGISIVIFISILRDYWYAQVIASAISKMRHDLMSHLTQLATTHPSLNSKGSALTYFSSDVKAIESGFFVLMSGLAMPCLSLLFSLMFLSLLNWKLTLLSTVLAPIIFFGPSNIIKRLDKKNHQKTSLETHSLSLFQETLEMLLIINVFSLSQYIVDNFYKLNKKLEHSIFKAIFISTFIEKWAEIIPVFLQIVMLSVMIYLVVHKVITISVLIGFHILFTTLIYALMRITYCLPTLSQYFVSAQRIAEFLSFSYNDSLQNRVYKPFRFTQTIRFVDVTFLYNHQLPVLNNITLEIAKNKFVAIVGASGAGKSTLLNLLLKFYTPSTGKIFIDSENINDFSNDELRSHIGYIPQEILLFHMTIYENIKLGNHNATSQEIKEAATKAEIHNTIMNLPEQYNTLLGANGAGLSGGQRQRIAIARALLRKPDLLILDEPTSSLDSISEGAIIKTLTALSKTTTTIAVTHRLNLIKNADIIYLLDKGIIVEQGNHLELIQANGWYKKLWVHQHHTFKDNYD